MNEVDLQVQTNKQTAKKHNLVVEVMNLFIYLGYYVAFNTVQVISRRVVGRAEETSTYSLLGFCTVNCRPTASNYQLSHMRPCRESNPGLRGGRQECYHSATVATLEVMKERAEIEGCMVTGIKGNCVMIAQCRICIDKNSSCRLLLKYLCDPLLVLFRKEIFFA